MVMSTQTVSGVTYTIVEVTLNDPTASANRLNTSNTPGAMQWIPSANARDTNGIGCDTTVVTEQGGNDADL
jgi:hypothetical protein